MERSNDRATGEPLGKNSQVGRLMKIVRQTNISLILGVVLLVLLFIVSVGYVNAAHEELESSNVFLINTD